MCTIKTMWTMQPMRQFWKIHHKHGKHHQNHKSKVRKNVHVTKKPDLCRCWNLCRNLQNMWRTLCGTDHQKFSTRWNTHRKLWNEGATNDGDRTTLLTHYNTVHGGSRALLAEVFSVTFVEKSFESYRC